MTEQVGPTLDLRESFVIKRYGLVAFGYLEVFCIHCSSCHFFCEREAPYKDMSACMPQGTQTSNAAGYHEQFCFSDP